MRSFRLQLALRFGLTMLAIFLVMGAAWTVLLRVILYRQLDRTLLALAEVEALAGASASSSHFQFHEGVFLTEARHSPSELVRFAELWTDQGAPVVRSANLGQRDLPLPPGAMADARREIVGHATFVWEGARYRSIVYPLRLVGTLHAKHYLEVAGPLEPVETTLWRSAAIAALLGVLGMMLAMGGAWWFARVATRPAQEIAAQAEAIEAGTLSARITAHAEMAEYHRLVAVLNAMLDRLDRAFQAQRRFVADASHELRSPLTVLKGDIDVALRRERSQSEYRAVLESGREEVDRMAKLADNLLTLARTDSGLPSDHLRSVDLEAVVRRAAERSRDAAAAAGLALTVEGAPAVTRGDAGLLERAVGNLVENAVKYTPPGTRISVRCTADAGVALVEVEDTGPGIPPEHAPHVFERFYRGDPARSRGSGAGLGLPIAAAIAEAHGGSLRLVRAAPGALFRLTVPAVPES
jgi:two-component system, OmpR family, sensor kinase